MSNPLRTLIVEDSEDDAVMLLRELRRAGYEVASERVETAEGMNAALDRAEWDVVFSDYSMPHFSAPEALALLKNRQLDLPFIIISGTIGEETAVNSMKAGAQDFLVKGRLVRLVPVLERELGEAQGRRERRRAEEALRESEKRYRLLFERNFAGVIRITTDGHILECNPAMAHMLGFELPQQVLSHSVLDLFYSQEIHAQIVRQLEREGGLSNLELRLRRKDGSPVWLIANVNLLAPTTGGQRIIEGTFVDITERKLTESENTRLALIVNSSDDAIFSVTREGLITTWNAGAQRMYGYAAEEIMGKSISVLVPEDRQSLMAANREKLYRGEALIHYEFEHIRKDGLRLHVSLTLSPIKDTTGFVTAVSAISRDITERKRAEEQLREEKNRAQVYLDIAGVMLLALNPDQEVELINLKGCEILGYRREEIIGKKWCDNFVPARDRDQINRAFEKLKVGDLENVEYLENPIERKTGEERLIAWHNTVLRDGSGKIASTLSSGEDITERMRATAELEKQHNFVEAVLDSAQSGIIACNDHGFLTVFNHASREIFGLPQATVPAEEWAQHSDLYLADGKTRMKKEDVPLFRALRGEHLSNVEMMIIPKRGEPRVVLTSGQPIIDANGRNLGAVVAFHDITERKRAEAERARLVMAIEQSAEGVVITNTSGDIEYVNPAFSRITGYGREEVLGRNPRILKSEKQDPEFYQKLWATILRGETWHGELINQRKDGKLYTEEMNVAPVRDERGKVTHFIATKQDVSERKLLENQFRQAQKMESVGRLAGGVAHDFNNLLTIINGYSEMTLDRLDPSDPARGPLEEIRKAGDRAASLTRQLLAFSRQQVLAPRVLDLNAVVADVEKMLRRLIGEDIELAMVRDSALRRVKADPGQVEQIIVNLAVNARDAMPQGGKLVIQTANAELDEAYTDRHGIVPPGRYVQLAISDTGIGMDAETQAHIFEPFFTTKEKDKGTGLGLAMVYGIVKQSGGFIWVYSEPGRGTTFKIYLPRVEDAGESVPILKSRDHSVAGSETILLVEDEEAVRALAVSILQERGYKVLESTSPEDAIRIGERRQEPIHLLVTDVVMPRMSGRKLSEHLAFLRPDMKVLFMSGYTDDSVVRHGVLEATTAFLQKPFTPSSLSRKVREVLDARNDTTTPRQN